MEVALWLGERHGDLQSAIIGQRSFGGALPVRRTQARGGHAQERGPPREAAPKYERMER